MRKGDDRVILTRLGWRSLLFVGADRPDRIAKIAARGADAVILDLEDAVAPEAKPAARAALPDSIADLAARGQPLVVRINTAWRDAVADLAATARPGVAAVMVPGCTTADRLAILAEMLAELEAEGRLAAPIALVESTAGLLNLAALAAAPRVIGLALGPEDLSLDMGVAPTPDLLDLPSRQIAIAARAYGIMALAVPISIGLIADEGAYGAAIERGRAYGVTGAICIHPRQVELANTLFRPSAGDIADARAVMAAWDARAGAGVIALGGRMIDLPVAERARRLLARAGAQG